MDIQVKIKNQYGNERIFPHSNAKELHTLTKMQTLSRPQVDALKVLGHTVTAIEINGIDIATQPVTL